LIKAGAFKNSSKGKQRFHELGKSLGKTGAGTWKFLSQNYNKISKVFSHCQKEQLKRACLT
jgi:hypothetical protein